MLCCTEGSTQTRLKIDRHACLSREIGDSRDGALRSFPCERSVCNQDSEQEPVESAAELAALDRARQANSAQLFRPACKQSRCQNKSHSSSIWRRKYPYKRSCNKQTHCASKKHKNRLSQFRTFARLGTIVQRRQNLPADDLRLSIFVATNGLMMKHACGSRSEVRLACNTRCKHAHFAAISAQPERGGIDRFKKRMVTALNGCRRDDVGRSLCNLSKSPHLLLVLLPCQLMQSELFLILLAMSK